MAHLFSSAARAGLRSSVKGAAGTTRFASTQAAGQASTPFMASKAAAFTSTAVAVGTLAWYQHMYGSGLPLIDTANANMIDEGLHPPKHNWPHSGYFSSFDHAS